MSVLSRQNHGRIFEVIHGSLGPWNGPAGDVRGSAFSEYEFRRIHPAPAADADNLVDAETYYATALKRLLGPQGGRPAIIREVADRQPDPTPDGPEANPPQQYRNPMATAAVAELANKVDRMAETVEKFVEAVKPALTGAKRQGA
jgi:hypothetical protein